MPTFFKSYLTQTGLLLLLFLTLLNLSACKQESQGGNELFLEAEDAYKIGDYDRATAKYNQFLKEHPNSSLTDLATQRVENIKREFHSIMSKPRGLHPIYLKPRPSDTNRKQP